MSEEQRTKTWPLELKLWLVNCDSTWLLRTLLAALGTRQKLRPEPSHASHRGFQSSFFAGEAPRCAIGYVLIHQPGLPLSLAAILRPLYDRLLVPFDVTVPSMCLDPSVINLTSLLHTEHRGPDFHTVRPYLPPAHFVGLCRSL